MFAGHLITAVACSGHLYSLADASRLLVHVTSNLYRQSLGKSRTLSCHHLHPVVSAGELAKAGGLVSLTALHLLRCMHHQSNPSDRQLPF